MSDRVCGFRYCDVPIDDLRPQALYCCPSHKAAEHRAKAEDRGRGTGSAAKPYKNVRKRPRRATRAGNGTRLYVVGEELALVRDLLATRRARQSPARDGLLAKLPAAEDRIGGKAA